MVRTLQAPAAPEFLFTGAQVLNVVNPDKRSRAALLFTGRSNDSNRAVLIAFDRFDGRVDVCAEEYCESVTEIQERLPVVGFTHVLNNSVVNTEFPWFGSLSTAVVHTLGDGSFDKALVKQYVNLSILVLVKDSLYGQGQEVFQAPYLPFSSFTLPGCLVSALLGLSIRSRDVTTTIFAGSTTAVRIGFASEIDCDIDVLRVFISFDDPFFVLIFRLFISRAFRGFVAVVDVSFAAPMRSVTPSTNVSILGVDGNNPGRAKISAKIAPTADHLRDVQASFFEFLNREVFFIVFESSSSHMFFPSISVDRGFFFTLIMRVVVGVRVVWRAGRLALGTPRGAADPILPATPDYLDALGAGSSSSGLASRMGCVSSAFGLLVMNTGPLIMMCSALITIPGLYTPGVIGMSGTRDVSDMGGVCDAVGVAGFGPYPHKVRVPAQADMALLTALTNRKMISTISPFGIFDGSTGGFAHAGRKRVSIFPSQLTSDCALHNSGGLSSRVLVKKGRHHQWWCGSPRSPWRRAGMGRVGADNLVRTGRPRPHGTTRPVRRKEVAA